MESEVKVTPFSWIFPMYTGGVRVTEFVFFVFVLLLLLLSFITGGSRPRTYKGRENGDFFSSPNILIEGKHHFQHHQITKIKTVDRSSAQRNTKILALRSL